MATKKLPRSVWTLPSILFAAALATVAPAQTTRIRFGVLDARGLKEDKAREFLGQSDVPIRAVIGGEDLAEAEASSGSLRARVDLDLERLESVSRPFPIGASGVFAQRLRVKATGQEFLFTFGRGENLGEIAGYVARNPETFRGVPLVGAVRGDEVPSIEAARAKVTGLLGPAYKAPGIHFHDRTRFVTAAGTHTAGPEAPRLEWSATMTETDEGEFAFGTAYEFGITDSIHAPSNQNLAPSALAAKLPDLIKEWIASNPLGGPKLRMSTAPVITNEARLIWKSNEFRWLDDSVTPSTEHHCSFRLVFALEDDTRWSCQAIGYHLAIDTSTAEVRPRPLAEVPGIQVLVTKITSVQ